MPELINRFDFGEEAMAAYIKIVVFVNLCTGYAASLACSLEHQGTHASPDEFVGGSKACWTGSYYYDRLLTHCSESLSEL
jgi:hypothetical protein